MADDYATWVPQAEQDVMMCQELGCKQVAFGCYLSASDEPDDWYCAEHASAAGYCGGCGHFWAGVESFDFNARGLCENCR
jgi:hypothetical protein